MCDGSHQYDAWTCVNERSKIMRIDDIRWRWRRRRRRRRRWKGAGGNDRVNVADLFFCSCVKGNCRKSWCVLFNKHVGFAATNRSRIGRAKSLYGPSLVSNTRKPDAEYASAEWESQNCTWSGSERISSYYVLHVYVLSISFFFLYISLSLSLFLSPFFANLCCLCLYSLEHRDSIESRARSIIEFFWVGEDDEANIYIQSLGWQLGVSSHDFWWTGYVAIMCMISRVAIVLHSRNGRATRAPTFRCFKKPCAERRRA